MLELGPIFRALLRHKTAALLIILQIALTLTIIVNAVFMIQDRHKDMQRDSGINEADSFYLTSSVFAADYDYQSAIPKDLDLLRNTPGVVDAIYTNSIPFSGYLYWQQVQLKAGKDQDLIKVGSYMSDDHTLNTFALEVIAGENFSPADVLLLDNDSSQWSAKIIISKAMAQQLYPGDWQQALDSTIYVDETVPLKITAIVKTLQGAWTGWDQIEKSMLAPIILLQKSSFYFIRTEPGRRDELMPVIEQLLAQSDKNRVISQVTTIEDKRASSYKEHNATNKILQLVVLTLVLVTCFGIVGLATFNIKRRTKQIGTRRALGATRWQIMRYFMLENFMISLIGVVLGCFGAISLNIYLVQRFSMNPVGGELVIYSILAIVFIGQLAVFYPARKASLISPAMATRTA